MQSKLDTYPYCLKKQGGVWLAADAMCTVPPLASKVTVPTELSN